MPLLAQPTTIALIQDAFRAALEGLTPRVQRGRDVNRWKYHPRAHQPGIGARWFRFEWERIGDTERGFQTHSVYELDMRCLLVTDYGGIPEHEVDAIVHDDHEQVAGVLDALRRTTDGLRRVLPEGWTLTDDSKLDQAQIGHQYLVRYLQAKP